MEANPIGKRVRANARGSVSRFHANPSRSSAMTVTLTVFQGRTGDHNDWAIPGARLVATTLEGRFGKLAQVIGTPTPALILSQTEILGIEIAEFQPAFRPGGPDVSPEPLIRALEPIWSALGADPQTRA